ncbi:DgyrCDS7409 [Dimorphilus gyrociliatus]|uniref:DgyrCDS7409 n=1 Tax=Dimorphilus gyrociliatus TaxID=2664684 RepID=A0A7I8VR37_9ANNE|nr:DgyrCDS7409 [Dimorphilus gyrociliatus]
MEESKENNPVDCEGASSSLSSGDIKSIKTYSMKPIAYLQSVFKEKNGTPRQSNTCSEFRGKITIGKDLFTNPEHSLEGLSQFSHIWIIFIFHQSGSNFTKAKIKPPRLNNKKVGVFSCRSPHRPNPVGLTLAKLESIEDSTIYVSGIDIIDGTPILDVKPYISDYDYPKIVNELGLADKNYVNEEAHTAEVHSADWIAQANNESLTVRFTLRALNDLETIQVEESNNLKKAIVEVLRNDPRSVYRRKQCCDRLYYFSFNQIHVTCWFDDDQAEVLKVKQVSN